MFNFLSKKIKVNVLPPSATAMVNHRIHPAQTVKEVRKSPRRLTMDCMSISLRDIRVIGLSLSPKEFLIFPTQIEER